jgi:transposase InsO family protein
VDACRYFNRSKSGFYKRIKAEERRQQEEEKVLIYIQEIRKSGINCGSRKMQIYLERYFNFKVGRDRLFNIMAKHDLQCRYYKQKVATSSGRRSDYPNLLKKRDIKVFGEAIVTDITYIRLPRGKFCYASVISDVRTRMILGCYISENLLVDGSMKALIQVHKNYELPSGAIHHSDHGVQYTSHEYTSYLKSRGMKISMTGAGKCYDNAQAERIFNTLKYEYGFKETFSSIKEARRDLSTFVHIYNNIRIHSSLCNVTPKEMYESLIEAA